VLTKDALCQLSYIGPPPLIARLRSQLRRGRLCDARVRARQPTRLPRRSSFSEASERNLERETGIEPATNSLEGCDSTTELLPPILPTDSRARSHRPSTRSARSGHSPRPSRPAMSEARR